MRIFNKQSSLGVFLLLSSVLLMTSCQEKAGKFSDPLSEHRDSTLKPGDDFFYYSNGGWFKANPISASESHNGIYLLVQDSINNILRIICDDCSKNPGAKGTVRQKIGDFYASGMDTTTREKEGIKPLEAELGRVAAVKDMHTLFSECSHLHSIGCSPLFTFYINRDDKISSKYAVFVQQGGLGLPDRDYYFKKDSRTSNIRDKYVEHVHNIFVLSGEPEAQAAADSKTVFEIEKTLAKSCRTIEELRDPYKNYNKMTAADFNKLSPTIEWKSMFSEMGLPAIDTVIIGQPGFIAALEQTLKSNTIDQWKAYFKWKVLSNYSGCLGNDFEKENFHFNHTVMTGSKEQKPRWKRMVERTEGTIGEIVAQEYVAHYVPEHTKEKLMEMAKNIQAVYADHLKNLDWMSEATKTKALHKLNGVVLKMGYPDKWKDFSKLEIDRSSYAKNIMNVEEWYFNYMINRYGKAVDRTEWNMTPETYNAYYEPTNNEIVIPACNVIIPGFGKGLPDDAVLYGVIGGSTMGHELTHGFDDEGCQYDEKGNLNNWWTKEDSLKFSERANKLAEQFDKYVVLDSMHVRGKACLGENIADLGGVIMGYEAFQKTEQWKKHEKINGLTPDQRYFLAYAYSWMEAKRNEALAKQIMSDVHAPAQWRANGPLSNITAFYTAFDLKPENKMYRAEKDRVKIW
jgi:putative endopeptidase